MRAALLGIALVFAAGPALAQEASPWALPAEGSCAPSGGTHVKPGAPPEDATAAPFKTGESFAIDRIAVLERYLPDFLWTNRERFFYEGMRLEIGPCFRDYGAPDFFTAATEQGRGKATLVLERRALGLDGRAAVPSGRDRAGRRATPGCAGSGTCRAATRPPASAARSA